MNKLLVAPLAVLTLIALLSSAGLGGENADFAQGFHYQENFNPDGSPVVLYDTGGHAVCYYNFSAVDEAGTIVKVEGADVAAWSNASWGLVYPLYYDTESAEPVGWEDVQNPIGLGAGESLAANRGNFGLSTAMGLIAAISIAMGLIVLASIKIFGIGVGDFGLQTVFVIGLFITVWGVLSLLAYPTILLGGYYVYIIYFALTIGYTIGLIGTVSNGGNND